jgi:hypothetical protein
MVQFADAASLRTSIPTVSAVLIVDHHKITPSLDWVLKHPLTPLPMVRL